MVWPGISSLHKDGKRKQNLCNIYFYFFLGGLPWAAVDSLGLAVHRLRVPELCLIEKYVLTSKRRINKKNHYILLSIYD